jgi:hypothetical protein
VTPPAARALSRPAIDGRVIGTFLMTGRIVTAVRVRGESPGQRVTRRWRFVGRSCNRRFCRRLVLHRERSDGHFNRLVLHRVGAGRYVGQGQFTAALSCLGRVYRAGESVPYTITVRVTAAVRLQGIAFASRLSATYTNVARADDTPCPLGPSHDAARYRGGAHPLLTPPAAAFIFAVNPVADIALFADHSTRGAGGAPIVTRRWTFGDPASGAADTASGPDTSHHFLAPGVYVVTLTVTDTHGLTATETQSVTVPGPPAAAPSLVGFSP